MSKTHNVPIIGRSRCLLRWQLCLKRENVQAFMGDRSKDYRRQAWVLSPSGFGHPPECLRECLSASEKIKKYPVRTDFQFFDNTQAGCQQKPLSIASMVTWL